jgi:hypothetical protein
MTSISIGNSKVNTIVDAIKPHGGQELKRSINGPDTEAQGQPLQIVTFGLQRAAGPYRWVTSTADIFYRPQGDPEHAAVAG